MAIVGGLRMFVMRPRTLRAGNQSPKPFPQTNVCSSTTPFTQH